MPDIGERLISVEGKHSICAALWIQASQPELIYSTAMAIKGYLPHDYMMPCGNVFHLETFDELDIGHDVPCPCGDPSHWFVKYVVKPE